MEEYIVNEQGNYEPLACRCKDCEFYKADHTYIDNVEFDWCEFQANWIISNDGNAYCAWGRKRNYEHHS